jgi:hypothetical protein
MADRKCTAEEALGVLKYLARESHRSVHEVAADLVAQVAQPAEG